MLQITVENCGRFFDDFVVTENGKHLQITAQAKDIQKPLLKRWLTQQAKRNWLITNNNAQGLVHVGSELGATKDTRELVLGYRDSGKMTQTQAKELAQILLKELFGEENRRKEDNMATKKKTTKRVKKTNKTK